MGFFHLKLSIDINQILLSVFGITMQENRLNDMKIIAAKLLDSAPSKATSVCFPALLNAVELNICCIIHLRGTDMHVE